MLKLRKTWLRRFGFSSLVATATAAIVLASMVGAEFDPKAFFGSGPRFAEFFSRLVPPDWSVTELILRSTFETLMIALAGTALAVMIALPIGFLAALNVVPAWLAHSVKAVLGFIRSMFPAAPIIYMRRDPRDVCLSIYTRMFADGHRYACDLEWLAHYYSMSVRLLEHWKTVSGDRILEVIYEDLVADPTEQTRNIAAFCELQWDPACLEFHKQDTASFTFSELQVREPINTKSTGAWRNYESQLAPLLAALKKPR